MPNQATGDGPPSTAAAAQLLKAGDSVGDRAREAVDVRTQAVLDSWMAVATLAYSLAFALSTFGEVGGIALNPAIVPESGDGRTVVFLIMAAFFTATVLAEGLTNSLRKPAPGPSRMRRFLTASASTLPLVSLLVLTFAAPAAPLIIVLSVAVVAALPMVTLALRSASRARTAGIRRPAPVFTALPDPADRVITVVLGLALGAIGAATGLPDPVLGTIAFIVFALTLMATRGGRAGLGRVAEYWGRTQWAAFGSSYLLVLGLAVLLARTEWDLTPVGIIGGILVAAPLVVAAFRPAPVWEAE
jgi:hypothetical protein